MQLSHAIPDGVDYFFDSIGGAILDSCIPHVKRYGYICVNGAISGYNGNSLVFKNWDQVIFNRITLKGPCLTAIHHLRLMQRSTS